MKPAADELCLVNVHVLPYCIQVTLMHLNSLSGQDRTTTAEYCLQVTLMHLNSLSGQDPTTTAEYCLQVALTHLEQPLWTRFCTVSVLLLFLLFKY